LTGKQKKIKTGEYSQLDLWGAPQPQEWEKFEKARDFARSLMLADEAEWKVLVRRRGAIKPGIPGNPDKVYRNLGWSSWKDWLGIADQSGRSIGTHGITELQGPRTLWDAAEESQWLPFDKARQVIRELGLEYEEEWHIYADGKLPGRNPLPYNIPREPDSIYRFVGWKGWKDWLIAPENRIEYTGFSRAHDFARSTKVIDAEKWKEFVQQNATILQEYGLTLPERPHLEYKENGWQGWKDWLGLQINYHDFKTTRKFIHSLKLKDRNDWLRFCSGQLTGKSRRTENIYVYPDIAFRNDGWDGWNDWLGVESTGNEKSYEGIPAGAVECRCKGRIEDCSMCDGKGYYYIK